MRLKLRLPQGSEVLSLDSRPDGELTIGDLADAIQAKIGEFESIKGGYPPKAIALDDKSKLLSSAGVRSGDQLVVGVPAGAGAQTVGSTAGQSSTNSAPVRAPPAPKEDKTSVMVDRDTVLKLRVMEDDNSCLFRAVGYALTRDVDSMRELRQIIASAIKENPVEYNDAILGKKRSDYIDWIQRDNSWGGAIELSILAKYFGVTILSLDVSTGRVDEFNPGQSSFIAVVYSGIHYDAVALVPAGVETGELDVTVFEIDERGLLAREALDKLGKKLKDQHYYTDTATFALKCNICGARLQGEKEATKHAMSTGHTNFGEF